MVGVTVDDVPTHKGPTLPVDFPAHLLLRICNSILAPLVNESSPLKPYSRPWSRSTPATWHGSRSSSVAAGEREEPTVSRVHNSYTDESSGDGRSMSLNDWRSLALSAKGNPVTSCKSDLLAWVSSSRRMWETCGSMVFHHVRVTNLAIGDILVSRRNYLRNTRVLEIYITREVESSQAQTDLNLARFFIQASIILLWCPVVQTVILDIKAVPADDYIWASFLSRLKQRLFIKADTDTTPQIRTPPTMPITALTNVVNGSGGEQSTSRNPTARWGDSQGLLHSHDRQSIPNLAIGLGYSAAGGVPDGFIGTLATMLSPHTPGRGSIHLVDYPFRIPLVHYFPAGELDFLTSLDILIPRPSWGHEEAEGFALGLVIRRLTGLKRLSVHADGVIQHNSGNYGEFGLMRKPPFSTTDTGDDDSDDPDSHPDMVVAEDGTVVYSLQPSGGTGGTPTQPGQISIVASPGTTAHGGYGPETWWAGLFNALTVRNSDLEEKKRLDIVNPVGKQSIEELRISVSIPGGYVQLADFDAYFAMVAPYFQRMTTLETLVFDMVVDLQSESTSSSSSYINWSRNGPRAIMDHFERQRGYVRRLIDPHASVMPLIEKPELLYHRSEPYYRTGVVRVHGHHGHPHRAGTHDSAFVPFGLPQVPHSVVDTSGPSLPDGEAPKPTPNRTPLARNLRHVYFGEYHGIPALHPPDFGAGGAASLRMGGSKQGGEILNRDASLSNGPAGEAPSSTNLSGGANSPKELGSKKKALGAGGAGVTVIPGFVGNSKGGSGLVRSIEAQVADDGVNVENQRSVPGMWWTIRRESTLLYGAGDEGPPQLDGATSLVIPALWNSTAAEGRVVVQGWEEVGKARYAVDHLTDVEITSGEEGGA